MSELKMNAKGIRMILASGQMGQMGDLIADYVAKLESERAALSPATGDATARKPVCATCNDTHRMIRSVGSGDEQEVMCTRCPRPCQKCRSGGNGPFCEKTPCGCDCHPATPEDAVAVKR